MHPELETLAVIGRHDKALHRLHHTIDRANKRVDAALKALAVAQATITELETTISANHAKQRATEKRIDQYTRQRDRAITILENGVGDPFAAERQLEQCGTILDQAETLLLELLDEDDSGGQQLRQARQTCSELQRASELIHSTRDSQVQELRAEIVVHQAGRTEALGLLPADTARRYHAVTRRRGLAVVPIEKGACTGCRMQVEPQRLADLKRGLLHTCSNCGRWVIP